MSKKKSNIIDIKKASNKKFNEEKEIIFTVEDNDNDNDMEFVFKLEESDDDEEPTIH